MDVTLRILCCSAMLAMLSVMFSVIAPIAADAKAKAPAATARTSAKASATRSAWTKVFDLDGYRPVSLNSTMMCAETLRSTLDCKQWTAP
jgi:hypothetical protein